MILICIGIVIGFLVGNILTIRRQNKRKLPSELCKIMHDEAARVSASSALPFETVHAHLKNCMVHGLYCPLKDKGRKR